MSQLDLLGRLQEIDTDIHQKKQRLGAVLQAQRETEALLAARARLERANEEVRKLTTQQQDLTLQSGTLATRVQQSERKLYSGKIQSPKELEDLQESIDALKRQRGEIDDDRLMVMMLLEDATAEQESAETDLQKIESAWNDNQAVLRAEQNELALALHGLIQLRKERAALIQTSTLATYEKIAKRKNGIGIASVEYSKCMACRVTVPANQIRLAQQGKLIICSSCGRILNPAG